MMCPVTPSKLLHCGLVTVGHRLATQRLQVQILSTLLPGNNIRQVVHTRASVLEQCKLVLVTGH